MWMLLLLTSLSANMVCLSVYLIGLCVFMDMYGCVWICLGVYCMRVMCVLLQYRRHQALMVNL